MHSHTGLARLVALHVEKTCAKNAEEPAKNTKGTL